jgi:hypothetical protein
MRKETMASHARMLPAYRQLRQIGVPLCNSLVASLDESMLNEGARRIGILKNGTIVLDSEHVMSVLMDFCIHSIRVNGQTAVQRFMQALPPRAGSEEAAILRRMLTGHYAIVEVISLEKGVGLNVRDVLRDDIYFVADIGLSTSARPKELIGTRLFFVEEHGFHMTGGAALPVTGTAISKINQELVRHFGFGTDFARIDVGQESELAEIVIRTCLATGMGSRIAYGTSAEISSGNELSFDSRERRRANRNDPCPCASGKKFKSCCGRRPQL